MLAAYAPEWGDEGFDETVGPIWKITGVGLNNSYTNGEIMKPFDWTAAVCH